MARLVLLLTAAIVASAPTRGGDWPQWGGYAIRNLSSAEKGLPATFHPGKRRRDHLGLDPATAKNVRWVARIGGENYSSATVADGRVYIGTNDEEIDDPRFETTEGGVLMCLDEKTGDLIWRLVVPKLEIDRSKVSEDFDAMKLGICSTATVDGDRVYVVTNRCEAICLDADGMADGNDGPFTSEASFMVPTAAKPVELGPNDADIVWRFDMLRDLPVFPHDATNCSILVAGDCAYVGTGNGVYDGTIVLPTAASLVALDKRTGRLLARDDGTISAGTFHGQWSSPTLATAGGRGGEPIDYWALVRGGARTLDGDGMLVSPSEIIGSPVFHDGRIYVTIGQDPLHGAGRGALTCLRADGAGDVSQTGVLWRYLGIGRSLSTVSVADGLVYAAEHAGKIHCLDATTGELAWVYDTREEIWSSTLAADGKVYVGTRRGLTILQAGRERKHLADVRLGSAVWSVPTAANGTLYVASQKHLFAIEEQGEMQ